MTTFEIIDSCPVPAKIADAVRECKRRSGQVLTSCDRSTAAEPLLRRLGKKSQNQLYWGFVHGLPGYNPANPPGFSTHERFNDGPAFPQYRRGARLPDELVGQDWSAGWAAAKAYNAMGIPAALTYPGSAREAQHVNIRAVSSKWKWRGKFKVLKRGMRGPSILTINRRLQFCVQPHSSGKRYLPKKLTGSRLFFSEQTEQAVKRFQRDHGLTADGVVGEKTAHQLAVSTAWWKAQRSH